MDVCNAESEAYQNAALIASQMIIEVFCHVCNQHVYYPRPENLQSLIICPHLHLRDWANILNTAGTITNTKPYPPAKHDPHGGHPALPAFTASEPALYCICHPYCQ